MRIDTGKRMGTCLNSNLEIDRNENAAINILMLYTCQLLSLHLGDRFVTTRKGEIRTYI